MELPTANELKQTERCAPPGAQRRDQDIGVNDDPGRIHNGIIYDTARGVNLQIPD